MTSFTLDTPLSKALSTTKAHLVCLEQMGLNTVKDLLLYFPRTYEEHKSATSISDLRTDSINTIEAKIVDFSAQMARSSKKWIYKALLEDSLGYEFEAIWFAKPYQFNVDISGKKKIFIGKAKYDFGKFTLQSPKVENFAEKTFAREIVPVYPATEKITSDYLLQKIKQLLPLVELFSENLPENLLQEEQLMSRKDALKYIHFPESVEQLEKARERLAFEELFGIQLDALVRKKEFQENAETFEIAIPLDPEFVKSFFASLPFVPTNAQKIAIFEILKDMEKQIPMTRLLEGDVGSGKTLVAATAAICAIRAGFQVAIMAPTEVLARQHYQSLSRLFQNFTERTELGERRTEKTPDSKLLTRVSVGLLLGSQKRAEKQETLLGTLNGEIDLVVGTHALIQESVAFYKLGLAVIDEQHRFGVEQRKKLSEHGNPHTLNMTATPIPRTLALVAYGDQDLSVLTELPPGRQTIVTKVVQSAGRLEISRFIDAEIEKGRQVYVVCPLIEESKAEMMAEVKSVTEEYDRLQELFPHRRIALMHGKLASAEKEEVMRAFKNRESDILVSTSVIEVGVDVPNATIMIIEGAERFGLSQLHQFRGRVGRGEFQSYCFLFTSKNNGKDNERLQAMEEFSDGFRLAEIDMRLRGPGEVYGVRQSGIPDLKMAQLTDQKFVLRVRQAAERQLSMFNEQ